MSCTNTGYTHFALYTMNRKCRKISKLSRKRYHLGRSSQIIGILSSWSIAQITKSENIVRFEPHNNNNYRQIKLDIFRSDILLCKQVRGPRCIPLDDFRQDTVFDRIPFEFRDLLFIDVYYSREVKIPSSHI
jgi:hypothetical protein